MPFIYFKECILFDLINGTDTHFHLPKEYYGEVDFENLHSYTASWTSKIINSYNFLNQLLGRDFSNYAFLDIGSGKGKVVCQWQICLNQNNIKAPIYGIDFNEHLNNIAIKNYNKLFPKITHNLFCLDATLFEYDSLGDNIIIYLNNPLPADLLNLVLSKINNKDVILIYSNPVFSEIPFNLNYYLINQTNGFHPNSRTWIYRKNI